MTNACKGSARKTHCVWGCSPWKRARTVFYPPSNGSGPALLLLLFLTEAACLATRWCDFVVNWVIAFTAAHWLFNPDVKSQVGCSATQSYTYTHCPYVHLPVYTRPRQHFIKGETNWGVKCWLEAEIWIHACWTETSAGEFVMWFMESRVASRSDVWRTPRIFDGCSLYGRHTFQLSKLHFFSWTSWTHAL